METKMADDEIIELKKGGHVPRSTVQRIMESISTLQNSTDFDNQAALLNLCLSMHQPGQHQIKPADLKKLQDLCLLDGDGQPYPYIKDVVLSAAEITEDSPGLGIRISAPDKEGNITGNTWGDFVRFGTNEPLVIGGSSRFSS